MICCEILDNLNLTNYINVQFDDLFMSYALFFIWVFGLSFFVLLCEIFHYNILSIFDDLCKIKDISVSYFIFIYNLFSIISYILLFLIFIYVYSNYCVVLTFITLCLMWFIWFSILHFIVKYLDDQFSISNSIFLYCIISLLKSICVLLFPLIMYLVASSNKVIELNLHGYLDQFEIKSVTLNNCPDGVYYFTLKDSYIFGSDIYRVSNKSLTGQFIALSVKNGNIDSCELFRDDKNVQSLFYLVNVRDKNGIIKRNYWHFYGFDNGGQSLKAAKDEDEFKLELEEFSKNVQIL